MTDILENELAEEENTEILSVPAEPEPVLTFYHYDIDGFYLGTTYRQEDNTTDVPFEYEPGFWFFFRNNEWEKVKIPETVSELDFDITLDDNATNYQKTLVSLAQRIFAEYKGEDYIFITEKDADTGLLSFRVRKVDPEIILDNHKQSRLEELHNAAESALETAGVKSSLGFKIDANEDAVRNLNGLVDIGHNDVSFCDYDNVIHEHVTAEQVKTMRNEVLLNGQNLYAQKWNYRAAVNAAETVDELNAITFKFDMLDFSE